MRRPGEERPEEILGEALWGLLDAASEPPEVEKIDPDLLVARAEATDDFDVPDTSLGDDPEGVLGGELWEILGQATEVAPSERPAPRLPRSSPPWGAVGLLLLAAMAPFVLVPMLRDRAQDPKDDLVVIRELEFAENIDLLSHPDFEVLTSWDGEAP